MRLQTLKLLAFLVMIIGTLPGCFVMQIGVSNPAPNLTRIGIAPFVNLSAERSVDGRRFAEAYYTELQKVPGFQVLPVGVVDSAMHDYNLNLDNPKDIEKLIDILDIDSLCFGAVTEYNPYYPPRLGLQISWYTTHIPNFQPGLPVDPNARKMYHHMLRSKRKGSGWNDSFNWCFPSLPAGESTTSRLICPTSPAVVRAQNETDNSPAPLSPDEQVAWDLTLQKLMIPEELRTPAASPAPPAESDIMLTGQPQLQFSVDESLEMNTEVQLETVQQLPMPPGLAVQQFPTPAGTQPLLPGENPDPTSPFPQPYMSYTRVFDGADAGFTASLRNYLELSGDQRSGGWTGYLHRSEDFIRFCMHRMILEMLQLHGGESQRRYVMTNRKH